MRKVSIVMCIVLLFVFVFSGCDEENYEYPAPIQPSSEEYEVVIKTVNVTEQPLSEIETNESDWFANNFNIYQPYIDENGGMYYNVTGSGDGSYPRYLYYDNRVDEPINLGLPFTESFDMGVIRNGAVYVVEYPDGVSEDHFITKYENGQSQRLPNPDTHGYTAINGCYFAEEGIYYQEFNEIYLMDYNGDKSELVVKIPDELYLGGIYSKFIVYQGKLWYCYDDFYPKNPYPLWCYDFKGTFTKFDKGGIDAVNNGYLYYQAEHTSDNLYRFNCETYCVELVSDAEYINSYAFVDGYILYTAWDKKSNTDNLYRMNNKENKRVLTPNKLRRSEGVLKVSSCKDRIFATGSSGMLYTCLAEIDINGKVLEIIHEDK